MKRLALSLIILLVSAATFVGLATEPADGYYLDRGFRGIVDFGAHIGFSDAEDNYQISGAFTGGYQINHFLFVGGGIAPTVNIYHIDWDHNWYDGDWYDDDLYDDLTDDKKTEASVWLPIYAAVRFDFINKKVTPFVDTRLGYFINTKDTDAGGLYFYGGVGARIKRFSVSAGLDLYRMSDAGLYRVLHSRKYRDSANLLYATLRFGFEF